jgi:hypothetical protein
LGDARGARSDLSAALDINPNFSIRWATTAADRLHALEAQG